MSHIPFPPRKLLANENIPRSLVNMLKNMGVDIVWLGESSERGLSDTQVITRANNENRVILTRDKDFMRRALIEKVATGVIFLATPVTKDNIPKLAKTISSLLAVAKSKLTIIYNDHVEFYNL